MDKIHNLQTRTPVGEHSVLPLTYRHTAFSIKQKNVCNASNGRTLCAPTKYEFLLDFLKEKLPCGKNLVAIDGKSGSGKSSLADLMKSEFDCNIFHMDDFFLPPPMRTSERLREIGGNVDYERFNDEIIKNSRQDKPFSYHIYDCKNDVFVDSPLIQPKKINIVEGVYSLHSLYRDVYDFKIYLTVSDDAQKARILKRNGEYMLNRYINEWIPLENAYFEHHDFENECDLVIDTTENM